MLRPNMAQAYAAVDRVSCMDQDETPPSREDINPMSFQVRQILIL